MTEDMNTAEDMNTIEDIKLPDILILRDEESKIFEEYDKRPLSKKEQDILKDADNFYQAQCAKTNE